MDIGSIVLAIFGIGLLIFLHEGGHFLAARAAGVRVEVFSLGFGPRVGGFVWRGTDFRLSAVPFGGYVMVAGQDPSDQRYPARVSLWSKSVGQRALFWSGGVLMNALFALIVFPIVFSAGVKFAAPVAGQITPGSAAWEARIEAGERILEVAGKPVYSMQNLAIEVALSGNRPVELLVEDADGDRRVVTVQPHFDPEQGLYGLGLNPAYDTSTVLLNVEPGSVAARAGLRTGDRVVSIDGDPTRATTPLEDFADVVVVVERDGERIEVTLTPEPTTEDVPPMIGVRPLPNRIAGIRTGSALVERLGLRRDDVVLAIDGRPFLSGSLEDYAASDDAETRWLVRRDGERLELTGAATPQERAALVERVALDTRLRLQLLPTAGGAAEAAGVLPGDWLQAIDGEAVADWETLRETVQEAGTRPLALRLLRPDPMTVVDRLDQPSGRVVELTMTPRRDPVPDLGLHRSIAPVMNEIRADGIGEALKLGTVCSLDLVKQLYVTMKRLVTGEVGAKNLGGIIRISQVSYQAAQRGPSWFWYFLALLSVNLAFVNLLPIPVLDGGHLMFLLIEKVKGSPVSTKVFGYSQVIGLVFVLLLVLFVTYNDILRLL
ncbi:MAG: RIP metalloprotease RseP [Planctomycetes bacterium]|nr:RIP metalloprotease RseP [Planctomycetota bacterium]